MRIAFTGGSGKAGRHCIEYLVSKGHRVINLDLTPLNHPGVLDLKVDLTDSGQVFNALTSHFGFDDFKSGQRPSPPDAVIHFAAIPRVLLVPDNECFRINVASTYNVIEASCKLGIKKIVIASSETVYGVCFSEGDEDFKCLPLDEDYDCDPMDTYALSKLCGERTARTFVRRYPGTDIIALRIGNVVEPHEYERDFPRYLREPGLRKRNAWSYIDARDLGQICDLCVTNEKCLGFCVLNATNDTITVTGRTEDFLSKHCPNTPTTRSMGQYEAPFSNRKLKETLGFEENHNWRQYVPAAALEDT